MLSGNRLLLVPVLNTSSYSEISNLRKCFGFLFVYLNIVVPNSLVMLSHLFLNGGLFLCCRKGVQILFSDARENTRMKISGLTPRYESLSRREWNWQQFKWQGFIANINISELCVNQCIGSLHAHKMTKLNDWLSPSLTVSTDEIVSSWI